MFILFKLFYIFFKIGLFSFGGGYAMLPMIYQDIQSFSLMKASEFSDVVAISQMTPGPIAVNAATYVGFTAAGVWGAVFATIGVSLPSIILILIVSAFLEKFKNSTIVKSVLLGIRPATVGLIASAVIFFSESSIVLENFFSLEMLKNPLAYISIPGLIIFALTIFATIKFKADPILLTILAGIAGAFIM
jgi:chromate transporter